MWFVLACHRDPPPPLPHPGATTEDPTTDTTPGTTPTALPAGCGDLQCDAGETCGICPVDCGACPPRCDRDGLCQGRLGETCPACRVDCDTRDPVCGNGACDPEEDAVGCMVDCGPPAWPEAWSGYEASLFGDINARRAAGGVCPSGPKAAVGSVLSDSALQGAARLQAWELSLSDYFSLESCNGRVLADRAPGARAENLGWGWPTPASVAAAWVRLPAECDAMFDPATTKVGVGFSDVGGDPLWVATFR